MQNLIYKDLRICFYAHIFGNHDRRRIQKRENNWTIYLKALGANNHIIYNLHIFYYWQPMPITNFTKINNNILYIIVIVICYIIEMKNMKAFKYLSRF